MMKKDAVLILLMLLSALLYAGCASVQSARFPAPNTLFVTTGDGDITKPYTPIGLVAARRSNFRFLWINTVRGDMDSTLHETMLPEVKAMGGDQIINLQVLQWNPDNPLKTILHPFGSTESTALYGTVVKR